MCSSSESLFNRAVVVERLALAAEANGDVDAWIEAEVTIEGLLNDASVRQGEGR